MAHIYIISADEPLLKKDASDNLMHQARNLYPKATFMLFNNLDFAGVGGTNLSALENELMDAGLFVEDKIIKIYLKDLDKTAVDVLMCIAKYYHDGLFIIIDLPRILASYKKVEAKNYEPEKKGKKRALESLKKDAIAYIKALGGQLDIIYAPDENNLKQWIYEKALGYKLNLTSSAINYLAQSSEGNLTAIDQILVQISLSSFAKNQIDEKILEQSFSQDARFYVYDFIDALLEANCIKALNILNAVCNGYGQNKLSVLITLINRLNVCFEAICKGKEIKLNSLNSKEQLAFFNQYGFKIKKGQMLLLKAIQYLPFDNLYFLIKSLNQAAIYLQNFDIESCILKLQQLAVAIKNTKARELEAIDLDA